ncbi:MAG: TetR/AcrR family transcriptional regulator C-terminal domain-containing protein [Tractidigestivibacter sp.]|jgi:AcrR family transcriptional regulator|uniref:TetR/AcrR family transcriptional regulator n=1 Tax=Tractidigestivibacter sp. TaxID=2847320 RepID=UPI003D92CC94
MPKRGSAEDTKKQIQDALISLYLESRDMEQISVSALSKRAGVARTTFYAYYDDAYDVMQDVQDTLMAGLEEIDQRSDKINIGAKDYSFSTFGAVDTLRFLADNRDAFVALLCDGGEPTFVHKVKTHIKNHLLEMLKRTNADVDQPDIVAEFVGTAMLSTNCYWLKNRPDLSPEEASSIILKLVDACLPTQ